MTAKVDVMPDPVLCRDCRWLGTMTFRTGDGEHEVEVTHMCRRPDVDLVTGESGPLGMSAQSERADPEGCGRGGRYFEAAGVDETPLAPALRAGSEGVEAGNLPIWHKTRSCPSFNVLTGEMDYNPDCPGCQHIMQRNKARAAISRLGK